MKILCLCEQGINRSVTLASMLKHSHETLSAGILTNSQETLNQLILWADKVILTDTVQVSLTAGWIPPEKIELFNVGPDKYPRPYNNHLRKLFIKHIERNKDWLMKNDCTKCKTGIIVNGQCNNPDCPSNT